MRIIDLINKVVNNEEVPKKIKFDGVEYSYNSTYFDYLDKKDDYLFQTIVDFYNSKYFFEKEIEIIECNQIKLEIDNNGYIHTKRGSWKGRKLDIELVNKITELEKEINELKNKD